MLTLGEQGLGPSERLAGRPNPEMAELLNTYNMVERVAAPQVSKEFWEDADWAKEHYGELQKKYKDVWVAVVGKKVVSHGKSLKEVEAEAERLAGRRDVFTMYVESGAAIY